MRYLITLISMMLKITWQPDWMQDQLPDNRHFYRRTLTGSYRAKKKIVKNIWIAAGLLMLINPVIHIVMLIALPVTLLSFVILDETL
ncbi:hypothetical protein [Endozoicomonas sp. 8E]|uniref:hypothetical protein n=1 Tax=Endozoicomonas sp. 8E TaxID=3035692 RepID=UPI0029392250|nr:hypothetical protein [Endozoicomonas sp. 8E]WOG28648.1 hypothetical protein P6910_03035 [Endozoicomonas sp. 8E]